MYDSPLTALSVASAVTAVAAAYYYLFAAQKPKVFARSSKMKKFLEKHVKTLTTKFYPSPIFMEGRLQTIFSLSQRVTTPAKLVYEREILTLSDGGEVALDYMKVAPKTSDRPPLLVIFLPGLTSSSQTSYVRTLVQTLNKIGASVVVFNNRGNGGVPFKTPKTYSACYIGDLEEVVPHVRQKFPEHRMIGLGTSLGGMVLSKYLVSHPKTAEGYLDCAILISIAWDCVRGSENLEKPFINRYLINRALAGGLIGLAKKFMSKFDTAPLNFDPKSALNAKTVREFDAAVTAPQFGFPNVVEYYQCASASGTTHKYSIPVFALSAEDDPIQPGELLPTQEAEAENSKLALIVTSRGGHLGWLEGLSKHSEHYMERLIGELVQGIQLNGKNELY